MRLAPLTLLACSLPLPATVLATSPTPENEEVRRLGTAVAVISAEELRGLEGSSLQDLSRLVPGLQGTATTPAGLLPARIRGTGGGLNAGGAPTTLDGALLVLVDDGAVRVLEGGLLANGDSLGDIDRIDVLRGPAATALYGSRGAAGVVIATKRRGDGRIGLELDASASVPIASPDGRAIDRRSATSSVNLASGETAVVRGFFGPEARRSAADYPELSEEGPLASFFASRMFREGRSDLFLLLRPSYTANAGGGEPIAVEARFIEAPVDLFDGLKLDFDYDAPLKLGGGLDSGAWLDSPSRGATPGPSATTSPGETARFTFGDTPGLQLAITPQWTTASGTRLRIGGRTGAVGSGGLPALGAQSFETSLTIGRDQSLALGGLVRPSIAAAWRSQADASNPFVSAMLGMRSSVGSSDDLVLFVTPEFGSDDPVLDALTAGRHDLAAPKAGGLQFSVGLDQRSQALPSFDWLRTESGGTILERPLLSQNADVDGAALNGTLEYGLEHSWFGGRSPRWTLDVTHFDADVSASNGAFSAGGQGLGIEDPNGSGFLIAPGFGDVTGGRFGLDYRLTTLGIGYGETLDLAERFSLDLSGGLRYEDSNTDAEFIGRTNGATLDLSRADEIDVSTVGPWFDARLSKEIGCCRAFAGLGGMLGWGSADASTRVDVTGFAPRARDLDESQLTYDLNLSLGAEWSFESGAFKLGGGVGLGNRFAAVEYQPTDPATLEFSSEVRTFLGAELSFAPGGLRRRP